MITTITLAVLKTNESDEDGGNYSITACTFIKHQKIDNLTHFQIEIPKRENFYDT